MFFVEADACVVLAFSCTSFVVLMFPPSPGWALCCLVFIKFHFVMRTALIVIPWSLAIYTYFLRTFLLQAPIWAFPDPGLHVCMCTVYVFVCVQYAVWYIC